MFTPNNLQASIMSLALGPQGCGRSCGYHRRQVTPHGDGFQQFDKRREMGKATNFAIHLRCFFKVQIGKCMGLRRMIGNLKVLEQMFANKWGA